MLTSSPLLANAMGTAGAFLVRRYDPARVAAELAAWYVTRPPLRGSTA
jgi:hypothetical protein